MNDSLIIIKESLKIFIKINDDDNSYLIFNSYTSVNILFYYLFDNLN